MTACIHRNLTTCLALILLACGAAGARAASPSISHEPVKQALAGQPLTLKAKVTSTVGVQAVTLYYTLSKDAAPFKVAMRPAGLDYYLGTIDGAVLTGLPSLSYYIEAEDTAGAVRETPWQVIALRVAKPGEALLRSCPGGSGKDRLVETCLLPGEEVEVWACRGPDDTLVACGDEAEMLQSPPAGGGLEKLRRESHSALAFALAWLCAWGLGALALLARSVPRVTAGESGEVTR